MAPLLFLLMEFAPHASATSAPSTYAKAQLIAERNSIAPGQDSWLGLHFKLEKGWHIYWINPGDSGEPPKVQWHLPAGFQAGLIHWPAPQRIEDHSLMDYGYLDEALLLVRMHVPADLTAGDILKFNATVKWLVCRETCIPERADLTLSLPVQREGAKQQSPWQDLFRTTRVRLPQPAPKGWRIAAASDLADVAPAKNYVSAALGEALQGRDVAVATTRPYGCSVKYAR
jgi:thiol:disulfide interchange protein DsbD